jgi:hypothetical protein
MRAKSQLDFKTGVKTQEPLNDNLTMRINLSRTKYTIWMGRGGDRERCL